MGNPHIQQGVAIGIFVRNNGSPGSSRDATVYHAQLWGQREKYETIGNRKQLVAGKYYWLAENDVHTTKWTKLHPQSPLYLFKDQDIDLEVEYRQGWAVTDILSVNNVGIVTGQDSKTIGLTKVEAENLALAHNLPLNVVKPLLYRPFDVRYVVYSKQVVTRPRSDVMFHMLAGRNLGLIATRQTRDQWGVLVTDCIMGHKSLAAFDVNTIFPLYVYPKEGILPGLDEYGTSSNLSGPFIKSFSDKLNMKFVPNGVGDRQHTFGPEDIFNYMYAIFHSPTYSERYTAFLKIEYPCLPLTSNPDLFCKLCVLGERLVDLHLMEKTGKITTRYPVPGNNVVEKIEYTQLANAPEQSRVWINKAQYFEDVPPEVWEFHVGGYQVCQKWLKDRKGRRLEFNDIMHYQRTVAALTETITLMEQIDDVIEEHGGWLSFELIIFQSEEYLFNVARHCKGRTSTLCIITFPGSSALIFLPPRPRKRPFSRQSENVWFTM